MARKSALDAAAPPTDAEVVTTTGLGVVPRLSPELTFTSDELSELAYAMADRALRQGGYAWLSDGALTATQKVMRAASVLNVRNMDSELITVERELAARR